MDTLRNKVAIVTGASSGIGRATARLFAREGAEVVVGARRQAQLDSLVDEVRANGGNAVAIAGDVSDATYAAALVDTALDRFGGLDIAFNNAGTLGALGPTAEMTLDDWEATLKINLGGAFLAAKFQTPALQARGGGALIFTSSFVGVTVAFGEMAAYAASKAGLVGLTKSLAVELAPHGIRVNALLPGATDTDMARDFAATPEAQAAIAELYPLRRFARPEEIAASALFLASEASSFTTGTALLVDGGVSIARV